MQLGSPHLIDIYRTRRTRVAGNRICWVVAGIAALNAGMAGQRGLTELAGSSLLILIGCAGSIAWTFLRPAGREFAWWPYYLGIWLSSIPCLYLTGGAESPFFAEYVALLFVAALVVQARFDWKRVLAFTCANAAGWVLFNAITGDANAQTAPPVFMQLRSLSLLAVILVCIHSLAQAERKLMSIVHSHSRELSEAHAMLTHSQRLADVGNLVASTAHEIAQPIQVISSSCALLSRLLKHGSRDLGRVSALVSNIEESSRRATLLLKELKNFSRRTPPESARMDLRDAVRSIQRLTGFDLRARGISLEVSLPDKPLWVTGDTVHIQQVLLNLINNARDACEHAERPGIALSVSPASSWARIEVSNNGSEIPLSAQARVFDSYFTTKGGGTGLGLSICARIVEQHGGRILFASDRHRTTFVVDLPLICVIPAKAAAQSRR